MSSQRFAILAAVTTHNLMKNTSTSSDLERHGREHQQQYDQQRSPNGAEFHGNVNVLLGGAMLSVVVTMVCFVCYCCHRNLRKRSESVYRQRWLDADANMEIYSVAQCYDLTPEPHADQHQPASLAPSLPSSVQGPPPSYETVVAMDQTLDGCDKCLQLHRSCSYTNCDHNRGIVHHQHHQPPIKLDNEPNNNANDDENDDNGDVVGTSSTTMTIASPRPQPPPPTPPPPQILNVPRPTMYRCNCDLYQQTCCGGRGGVDDTAHYEFIKKCKHCGSEINGNYCDCAPMSSAGHVVRSPRGAPNTSATAAAAAVVVAARTDNASANNERNNAHSGALIATGRWWPGSHHEPATTTTTANNNDDASAANDNGESDNGGGAGGAACDANCGCDLRDGGNRQRDGLNNNNNNNVDLNAFNEAGVIRMDMSQIIDQTGLPTYEAALKFESSGYV